MSASSGRVTGLGLLRSNRDFRLLYIATIVSLGGDWFATVALLGEVGDLTNNSALAKGAVFVAQSLPAFVMTPWAGPLADRMNRRTIMSVASGLQALAALGFLGIGPGRLWIAFVAMSTVTALSAFYSPASQASVPNLVEPDELPKATATLGATWGVMLAVGASVGALFTTAFGRPASFVADATSFAVAAALLAMIRRPTNAPGGAVRRRMRPVRDTAEALGIARRDPSLLALLLSKGGFGLSSGTVGLLTVLAVTRYHGGDGATGVLLAARGVGVVIGPLLASRLGRTNVAGILRTCAISCLVYAAAYGMVSWVPLMAIAAIFVAIAHLGGGAQWTLSTLGLQLATPDEFRGRILAADFALVTLTMSLSFVGAGLLESVAGVTGALLALAGVSCLWGLAYLRITSRLRASSHL